MSYKNVKYKKYGKCYFEVGNYLYNSEAMSIVLKSENGEFEQVCTVNMPDYMYSPNTASIKNYSGNSGMTKFLEKLGIIDIVYSCKKAHMYASNGETIDYCQIDVEKLKEYSKVFEYEWKI